MKKLAIITTHPIQYYAPLFKLLTEYQQTEVKVFYTWSQTQTGSKFDPAFGKIIEWDIPLLDGYAYEFVENISKHPGSNHYGGIENPGLIIAIDKWNPNHLLVIGWSFKSHLACLRYYKGKIPVLFRGDSTLLDETPGIKRYLRRIFLKWVYRHVDHALYVGKNNKAYFLAHGLKESQLIFAPHAIDNSRFESNHEVRAADAAEWRRKLGIADTDTVILFAGKLEEKKNPALIIELAKKMGSTQMKFIIAGNGKLEQSLKESATEDSSIIFVDFQNQQSMPILYRMADYFILPSLRNETWGLAINEAMACYRPVIVSDKVGCAPDLVEPGITGWTFEYSENTARTISEILLKAMNNPEQTRNMGSAAHQKIQEYSFYAIVNSIHQVLALKK